MLDGPIMIVFGSEWKFLRISVGKSVQLAESVSLAKANRFLFSNGFRCRRS